MKAGNNTLFPLNVYIKVATKFCYFANQVERWQRRSSLTRKMKMEMVQAIPKDWCLKDWLVNKYQKNNDWKGLDLG